MEQSERGSDTLSTSLESLYLDDASISSGDVPKFLKRALSSRQSQTPYSNRNSKSSPESIVPIEASHQSLSSRPSSDHSKRAHGQIRSQSTTSFKSTTGQQSQQYQIRPNSRDISFLTDERHSNCEAVPISLIEPDDFIYENAEPIQNYDEADILYEGGKKMVQVFPSRKPSGRGEVVHLQKWLDKKLLKINQSFSGAEWGFELDKILVIGIHEIGRQISVNCNERGEIMKRMWDLQREVLGKVKEQNEEYTKKIASLESSLSISEKMTKSLEGQVDKLVKVIEDKNGLLREADMMQRKREMEYLKRQVKLKAELDSLERREKILVKEHQEQLNAEKRKFEMETEMAVDELERKLQDMLDDMKQKDKEIQVAMQQKKSIERDYIQLREVKEQIEKIHSEQLVFSEQEQKLQQDVVMAEDERKRELIRKILKLSIEGDNIEAIISVAKEYLGEDEVMPFLVNEQEDQDEVGDMFSESSKIAKIRRRKYLRKLTEKCANHWKEFTRKAKEGLIFPHRHKGCQHESEELHNQETMMNPLIFLEDMIAHSSSKGGGDLPFENIWFKDIQTQTDIEKPKKEIAVPSRKAKKGDFIYGRRIFTNTGRILARSFSDPELFGAKIYFKSENINAMKLIQGDESITSKTYGYATIALNKGVQATVPIINRAMQSEKYGHFYDSNETQTEMDFQDSECQANPEMVDVEIDIEEEWQIFPSDKVHHIEVPVLEVDTSKLTASPSMIKKSARSRSSLSLLEEEDSESETPLPSRISFIGPERTLTAIDIETLLKNLRKFGGTRRYISSDSALRFNDEFADGARAGESRGGIVISRKPSMLSIDIDSNSKWSIPRPITALGIQTTNQNSITSDVRKSTSMETIAIQTPDDGSQTQGRPPSGGQTNSSFMTDFDSNSINPIAVGNFATNRSRNRRALSAARETSDFEDIMGPTGFVMISINSDPLDIPLGESLHVIPQVKVEEKRESKWKTATIQEFRSFLKDLDKYHTSVMSVWSLKKLLNQIYEERIRLAKVDHNILHVNAAQFSYNYVFHRYGLRSLALRNLRNLLANVDRLRTKDEAVYLYSLLTGMEDPIPIDGFNALISFYTLLQQNLLIPSLILIQRDHYTLPISRVQAMINSLASQGTGGMSEKVLLVFFNQENGLLIRLRREIEEEEHVDDPRIAVAVARITLDRLCTLFLAEYVRVANQRPPSSPNLNSTLTEESSEPNTSIQAAQPPQDIPIQSPTHSPQQRPQSQLQSLHAPQETQQPIPPLLPQSSGLLLQTQPFLNLPIMHQTYQHRPSTPQTLAYSKNSFFSFGGGAASTPK